MFNLSPLSFSLEIFSGLWFLRHPSFHVMIYMLPLNCFTYNCIWSSMTHAVIIGEIIYIISAYCYFCIWECTDLRSLLCAAECFKDRTDVQCLHRWQKVLNPELVKGPWSKEVNTNAWIIHGYVEHAASVYFILLLTILLLDFQEDEVIGELVKKYGPKKWSTIAQHLPGRIGKQCRER